MGTFTFGGRPDYIVGITMNNINISRLIPGTFEGLENMHCLDLSHNNLRLIGTGIFNGSKHLYDLNLANNNIKHIAGNAFENTPLRKLFLQENMISSLENDLFSWQRSTLSLIDLSYNCLKEINNTFVDTNCLKTLNLSYNNFEIVDFPNVHSVEVLLKNNNISKINALGNVTEMIDLSWNEIYLLEDSSVGFINSSIQKLYFSQNEIQLSENSFSSLPKLTHIYINNNKLSKIPNNVFKDLKTLLCSDVSHNDIVQFQYGTFETTPDLQYLNISHNNFTELSLGIFGPLRKLRELDIQNNEIKKLDIKYFLQLCPNLQKVNLNGNSWECDTLTNIVEYCLTNNVEIVRGNTSHFDNVRGNACSNDDFDVKNIDIGADKINNDSEDLVKINFHEYVESLKLFGDENSRCSYMFGILFVLILIFIILTAISMQFVMLLKKRHS